MDLDLRAQVAGHRCLYIADAVVYHKRGASTDNADMEVISRSWRNTIWIAGKNLPPLLLMVWTMSFSVRTIRQLLMSLLSRDRRQDLVTWYLPAFRSALALLSVKRRQTRHLRGKTRFGCYRYCFIHHVRSLQHHPVNVSASRPGECRLEHWSRGGQLSPGP